MKNFYILHPSPDGLTVSVLGSFKNFDEASDAADEWAQAYPSMPAIWISDLDDLMHLEDSIRKAREVN